MGRGFRWFAIVAMLFVPAAAEAATGSIHGTVTAETGGAGAGNYAVELLSAAQLPVASACTAGDGTYGFTGLATGTYYVSFSGDPAMCADNAFAPEWYNGRGRLDFADMVLVTDGQDTPAIDASLKNEATISGTAFDGTGPAFRVSVRASEVSGGEVGRTCTDANGAYKIGRLAGGVYSVQFVADGSCGHVSPYATQYYEDSDVANGARAINLGDGDQVAGINAHLRLVTATPTATASVAPTSTPTPGQLCQVRPRARVRRGKVLVRVACTQAATLILTGTVNFKRGGKRRTAKFKPATATGTTATFKVKVPRKAKRGHKLRAAFTVRADGLGFGSLPQRLRL